MWGAALRARIDVAGRGYESARSERRNARFCEPQMRCGYTGVRTLNVSANPLKIANCDLSCAYGSLGVFLRHYGQKRLHFTRGGRGDTYLCMLFSEMQENQFAAGVGIPRSTGVLRPLHQRNRGTGSSCYHLRVYDNALARYRKLPSCYAMHGV